MNKKDKNLKRQVWGILEDYGLFQEAKMKPWEKEYINQFFKDFLEIVKRYTEQKDVLDKK